MEWLETKQTIKCRLRYSTRFLFLHRGAQSQKYSRVDIVACKDQDDLDRNANLEDRNGNSIAVNVSLKVSLALRAISSGLLRPNTSL